MLKHDTDLFLFLWRDNNMLQQAAMMAGAKGLFSVDPKFLSEGDSRYSSSPFSVLSVLFLIYSDVGKPC